MNRIQGIKRRETFFPGNVRVREKGGEESSRIIEGVAIVFNSQSEPLYEDDELEIREVIAPEAVTRELLDASTILMTLYHDNRRLLARSLRGSGSLTYEIRDDGVHFSFEAPDTEDGRVALEAIRRGDITGCSFAFTVNYGDRSEVERQSETRDGKEYVVYTVKRTLTPLPAYPQTEAQTTRAIEEEFRAGQLEQEKARRRQRTIEELFSKSREF